MLRDLYGTESNAFLTSGKTAQTDSWASREVHQFWMTLRRVASVEKPGRNPN